LAISTGDGDKADTIVHDREAGKDLRLY